MCWAWNLVLTPQVMTKRPPGSSEDFLQYLLLLFFPFDFSYSTASSLLNLDPWFGVGIFCWTFGWTHGCLRASKEWSTSDRSWSLFGSQVLILLIILTLKVFSLSISSMSEEVTQQSVADVGVAWVGPRQLNYVSTPANRYVDTCHLAYIGPKLCRMSPWQLGPSGRLLVATVYVFYIRNILNSCKWPIPSMWTVKWIGPMTLLGWYIGTVSLCLDCAATLVIRGNIMELPGVLLEVSFLFQSVGQSSGPQQSPNHYLSRPLLFG